MSGTLGLYHGIPCHHWDEELPLVADVLAAARPRLIVEVGTMHGGFSAFLADTAMEFGGQVLTIDHVLYPEVEFVCSQRKNLFFLRGDIFSDFVGSMVIGALTAYANLGAETLLYCDGGAKRRELFVLGNFASFVGVHDYNTEVTPEECEAWVSKYSYVPIFEQRFAALQEAKGGYFVSRFWRAPDGS